MRLLVLLLLLLVAAPARAGTYEHQTLPGVDGWAPSVTHFEGYVAADASPDGLGMRFWARPWFMPGEIADWIYTPAADTTLAGWELERSVSGVRAGDWNTIFDLVIDGRSHHAAVDVPSRERPWGQVGGPGLGAGMLVAQLACGGPHPCLGPASMELRAARMVLHDGHAPTVTAVQGELAAERVLAGPAALSFAAADRGGGVHRAWAEVDGRPEPPVAIGDGRCRGGDAYRFAHRRPCPLEAGATVTVDTTALAEGRHVVAVYVEDAAGNRTPVYGPVARTVDNAPEPPAPAAASPPPAAPVVTAWLERRGRRRGVTVPYGERVRIRGRVTDTSGQALANAPVAVAEQLIDGFGRAMTRARSVTGVRTRPDGRFTAFTRVGPSRRLRFAGGPTLTVRVRAPLTVRVRGRLVRGRLLARDVRALVELQARERGRWVTRRVVRTFLSGRYAARAPGIVRARVPRQASLPYAAGLARVPVSPPRRGGRTGRRTSR